MSNLLVSQTGAVTTLTLNRPECLNALDRPLWPALEAAFDAAARDPAVRCVILTGAGRAFSPGADIREFERERGTAAKAAAYGTVMDRTYAAIRACDKPVIAKIRGACTGAGLVLALCCDLRFSGDSGRFGAPVARIGINMPIAEFEPLVRQVGASRALELLYGAEIIGADRAAAIGLLNRVVPDAELDGLVADYAARVAGLAPLAHQAHKRQARLLDGTAPVAEADRRRSYDSFDTADCREGYRAFLEKRDPRFIGG